jgi:O-methyltransferase/methyltransferase family protein
MRAKYPTARLARLIDHARSRFRPIAHSMAPGIALSELAQGAWVTQALYAAAKLGIADQLSDGSLSADEVAERVGSHPDATFRLMRALASFAVLKQRGDGRFALTALGRALRSDQPGSVAPTVLLIGSLGHWEHWAHLTDSVRTGEPAVNELRGMPFFDYLAANPAQAAVFNNAMSAGTTRATEVVLAAYDFRGFRRIVDVGGGHGRLLSAILNSAPAAEGVLYDLPAVVEGAAPVLSSAAVADRCTVTAGSFLDWVPEGGDAYVLKLIIHDWDDDHALRIVRNVRQAISPDGKLLLVEAVLPERGAPRAAALLDLEMLVNLGGKERTRAEFGQLLARAGFRLTRVVDTASPRTSVIEAVPI